MDMNNLDMAQVMELVSTFTQNVDLDRLTKTNPPKEVNAVYRVEEKETSTVLKLNLEIFPANLELADMIPQMIGALTKMSKGVKLNIKKA